MTARIELPESKYVVAAERRPKWRLVVLEEAGHVAQLEDPQR